MWFGRDKKEQRQAKLIVGLGNPGPKYAQTRHNAGFNVIDSLANELNVNISSEKFGAKFADVNFNGNKLILIKPWNFMNRSGQAVATAAGFYKIEINNILVAFDDWWLEPGVLRLRPSGSAGGHNGMADIIEKLKTNEFSRVRIGIGKPQQGSDYDYVLGKPDADDKKMIDDAAKKAVKAILYWTENGIEKTMNVFNETEHGKEQ